MNWKNPKVELPEAGKNYLCVFLAGSDYVYAFSRCERNEHRKYNREEGKWTDELEFHGLKMTNPINNHHIRGLNIMGNSSSSLSINFSEDFISDKDGGQKDHKLVAYVEIKDIPKPKDILRSLCKCGCALE